MTKILKKRYNPKDVLKKKQWSKYISKATALTMMHYNPDSILYKSYKNTSYCADVLATDGTGKLTTTYCKNRWCQTCNRIRTAILVNGYASQLKTLIEPCFVTLTLPTVKEPDLVTRISSMQKTWRKIYELTKKAKFKRTYSSFRGIRKSEVTIRPNGFYHYHYHLIVEGWAQSEWLIGQWLKRYPKANANAQDLRLANEYSLMELFKYAIKAEVKTDNKANTRRYDVVFRALRGKRTYQPFGGLKAVKEDFEDEDLHNEVVLEDNINSIYKWVSNDWYEKTTGEALIGIEIPDKVKKMAGYPEPKDDTT
jgi:hypothetical protein